MKKILFIILIAGLYVSAIGAQERELVDEETILLTPPEDGADTETSDVDAPPPAVTAFDFIKMIFFLGLVIAVIYLFFFFLKKMSGRNFVNNDVIDILGSRVIKGDTALHLIEVGGKIFLVGSGSGNLNLISEIEDKEALDQIRLTLSSAPENPVKQSFFNLFGSRIGTPKSADIKTTTSEGLDFIKSQRDKLKKL